MRRLTGFLLAIFLFVSVCGSTLAYEAGEHNEIFEKIFFGDEEYSTKTTGLIQARVLVLECASLLCIDQYNMSGEHELAYLQGKSTDNYPEPMFTVPGMPDSVSVINFNGNYAHRRNTHIGWNPNPQPTQGAWDVRKNILLQSVKKVMTFSSEKKADSFAAIVYYIHILGDHVHDKSYKDSRYMIPLARKTPGESNPDIFYELLYHFSVLFGDQSNTEDYIQLTTKMSAIAQSTRDLIRKNNEVFSEDDYKEYRGYLDQLMDLLYGVKDNKPYFRNLLLGIPSFQSAFGISK